MRVIVCGGRDFLRQDIVFASLDLVHEMVGPITEVVEGGQRTWVDGEIRGGADFWGWRWAVERGIEWDTVKADWNRWGSQAGFIRNAKMLRTRPLAVIGFPGGNGTADMLNKACWDKVPRIVFDRDGTAVPQHLQECK